MTAGPEGVVRFYNGRGTAEQWIKEGKYALNWTRLSCHRFVANRVRLSLFVLAYNLGNFLRRLCLPKVVRHWSLRSVQVKLIKMGYYDATISFGLPFEPEDFQYGKYRLERLGWKWRVIWECEIVSGVERLSKELSYGVDSSTTACG